MQLDNAAWYTKQTAFPYKHIKGRKAKKRIQRMSNGGNVAAMLLDNEIYFSHSKFDIDGTEQLNAYQGKYKPVGLLENRKFTTIAINENDNVSREYDTEAKFFEFVTTQKKVDDVFTITILSEKHICESCQGVVEQFREMFPKSTVNIISGKLGYNNDKYGTKNWKHRKKMETNG